MEEHEAPATPYPRGRATEARSPGSRSLLTSWCKGPWRAGENRGAQMRTPLHPLCLPGRLPPRPPPWPQTLIWGMGGICLSGSPWALMGGQACLTVL